MGVKVIFLPYGTKKTKFYNKMADNIPARLYFIRTIIINDDMIEVFYTLKKMYVIMPPPVGRGQ